MRWSHTIATDVGAVRQRNEDHARGDDSRGLFLLADGMGGHPAGHLASQAAIEAAMAFLTDQGVPGRARGRAERLGQALLAANQALLDLGEERSEAAGMGTTLVGIWLGKKHGHIAHVGDSRAYLYRDGELTQLTRDHTVLRERVDQGELDPEGPEAERMKHILTQAVGLGSEIVPDLFTLSLRSSDVFLLCSDGLSDLVTSQEIARILDGIAKRDLETRAAGLINAALAAGGHDNVTVVLVCQA